MLTRTASRGLVGGAGTLGLAMLVANGGNYLLNLLLGRWLTPAEFSDANLMVAFMLMAAAAAMCLQLVAARFVAVREAIRESAQADRLARRLRRWACVAGLCAGLLIAAPAPLWREVFNTASAWPFVILGAGMPAFLAQAVGRGVLQGRMLFAPLAATYVVELVVRLGVAVVLVRLGAGVEGATAGLTASFVATWFAVRAAGGAPYTDRWRPDTTGVRAYAGSVAVLLAGQALVSNADILVAKAFLDPHDAGRYAAVALIGRAVFFLSWSVAAVLFPATVQRHAAGRDARRLLAGASATITGIGLACALGAALAGGPVLGVLLGPEYTGLSGRLAAYAVVTTLFALANLVASQQLATGRMRESWIVLTGALAQAALLLIWHDSATQLIGAQLLAMTLLLPVVTISALGRWRRRQPLVAADGQSPDRRTGGSAPDEDRR